MVKTKEIFSTRIKEARNKIGYTQQEVSDEIGIARTAISKYENGELEPNIETLSALADFYNVSIDWLVGLGRSKNDNDIKGKDRNDILKELEKSAKKENIPQKIAT